MNNKVDFIFSTPIIRAYMQDCEQVNANLKRMLMEEASQSPSFDATNVGGWHGDAKLFLRDWPELQRIADCVLESVGSANAAMPHKSPEIEGLAWQMHGWANVSLNGAHFRPHCHPGSVWSGVYYVAVGEPSADRPESGHFSFMDPRVGAAASNSIGYPWGGGIFPVEPVAGMMLLFPSWMMHYTNPYIGAEPRISIAFNLSPEMLAQ